MSNHDFHIKAIGIAKKLKPDLQSKEESITFISGEKKSTIRNWLYSNKMPPKGKRLSIADRFGVDIDYLFGDAPYNLPITQYEPEQKYYLVPQLALSQLPCLEHFDPMPISGRIIISLNPDLTKHLKQVEKTYCVVSSGIDFEPFISASDTLFFNASAKPIKGNFCILVGGNSCIVRIQQDGSIVSNNGDTIKFLDSHTLLPIIITMSSKYVNQA